MRNGWRQRPDMALLAIAGLAAVLNGFGIWRETYANAYYTSAVTSMLQSFHLFFFASFDPGGFVTVDKPPVAFWVQTASAFVFGVHGWSVILPQALAGIGSVLLMNALVRPSFGLTAGRLSALVMACTPIAAAVSRTNNVDSLLVCTLLAAVWLLVRGLRSGGARWILAAFAFVGIGFNIKMLQAYMVLPAMYVLFMLSYKAAWRKKIGVLSGATALLLVVSLSWAIVVDAIPATKRPYIGSSQSNSVLELALGYNGIARLTGNGGPGGGRGGAPGMAPPFGGAGGQRADGGAPGAGGGGRGFGAHAMGGGMAGEVDGARAEGDGGQAATGGKLRGPGMAGPMGAPGGGGMPPGGWAPGGHGGDGRFGGGGGGGMFNTGSPGPLRLFQSQLSGQISWLLPFAAAGAIGLLSGWRRRRALTERQRETIFWLAWLLPAMGFFSVAEFFHPYYLIMLAPPIAALTGAGWSELRSLQQSRKDWKSWLLPAGIVAAAAFEVFMLYPYRQQLGLGWPIGVGVAGLVAALLTAWPESSRTHARAAALIVLLALLAAPAYWAATPMLYGDNSMLPEAGPQLQAGAAQSAGAFGRFGGGAAAGHPGMGNPGFAGGAANPGSFGRPGAAGGPGSPGNLGAADGPGNPDGPDGPNAETYDPRLLSYVIAHNTGEAFLFAVNSATSASPYIIESGKAVMAMGGFSGSDPILTPERLEQLVADKQIKYFLIGEGGFGGGREGSAELTAWIREHGKEVPREQWQSGNAGQVGSDFHADRTASEANTEEQEDPALPDRQRVKISTKSGLAVHDQSAAENSRSRVPDDDSMLSNLPLTAPEGPMGALTLYEVVLP
ncbi:glycosyltransferase family 39 protein [Paenibacillus athensensis]|uniref:Uncharacterized protein n=1 Tax=Paenibacillus athensensis TaxID=1967502 RepID=A0A4Y8Q9Z9_9BACL|nr:glycosyltransferase family 39 protein [Paenibacillus athensensis]MCD1258932.1 glycosyltransferase family 39 protein [Paenibacillus athensensis]